MDQCNEFVVIDFETTGLSAVNDKIIEIGAVKVRNGKVVDTYSTLVNPKLSISWRITDITGITNKMVEKAPEISAAMPELLKFIGDSLIVAHNVPFDSKFLMINANNLGYKINNKCACTLSLSRKLFPELKNHRLGTVAEYLKIDLTNAHRALDDAKATAQIYLKQLEQMGA